DDLDVAVTAELFAREQQSTCRPQSTDGADVGKEPEERRAVLDSGLERPNRTRCDLGGIVLALEVVGNFDRFRQRPGHIRAHDLAQEAFIRMKVKLEQAGQDQASS